MATKIVIEGIELTEGFSIHVNDVEFAPVQVVPDPDPPQKQEFNAGAFFSYIRTHLFWGSLSQSQVDYVGARYIVNGTDKAAEIAEMAELYETAIREGYA